MAEPRCINVLFSGLQSRNYIKYSINGTATKLLGSGWAPTLNWIRVVPAVLEWLLKREGNASISVGDLVGADCQVGLVWFVFWVSLLYLKVRASPQHGCFEVLVELKELR
eukprot:scaffold135588_cov37-Prasinocladus_malaysianus.AAC.2